MTNPFADQNPYESPTILAELADRQKPIPPPLPHEAKNEFPAAEAIGLFFSIAFAWGGIGMYLDRGDGLFQMIGFFVAIAFSVGSLIFVLRLLKWAVTKD